VRLGSLFLLLGAAGPLAAQSADSLVLDSPTAHLVIHAAEWAGLPRDTMRVSFRQQDSVVYEGVALADLLHLVGVPTDSLRGRSLALRVVIEASDRFRVVLSLADLDPTLGGRQVLIADRMNGQPLPANEAPFRLLIEGDQRASRWERQVTSVRVRAEEP
jgi:DMSO/TMAO reductase YedYZ molybdopterin-dependent catalytic subunit